MLSSPVKFQQTDRMDRQTDRWTEDGQTDGHQYNNLSLQGHKNYIIQDADNRVLTKAPISPSCDCLR